MTPEEDTSGPKTASPGAQSAASDPSPQPSSTAEAAEHVRTDMPRSGEAGTSSDPIDSGPGIALRVGNGRRGPQGVREIEVWAAADALVAAGQRPTIERVRAHLGGGSPNTVSPMLKRWFATLGPRVVAIQTDGSGSEMAQRFAKVRPEGSVPPVVDTFARKIWEVAYAEARLAFEAREAAARAEEEERTARFETKRVQLELQQSTFAETRDVLTSKVASAHESLRAVQGQLEDAVQSRHQKEHQALLLKHQLIEAQAAQKGLRRAWAIQKSEWEAETREAKMHAAELQRRLLMTPTTGARQRVKRLRTCSRSRKRACAATKTSRKLSNRSEARSATAVQRSQNCATNSNRSAQIACHRRSIHRSITKAWPSRTIVRSRRHREISPSAEPRVARGGRRAHLIAWASVLRDAASRRRALQFG